MTTNVKRLALSSGEPAGIGPDLCLQLSNNTSAEIVIIGNRELFQQRANELGIKFNLTDYQAEQAPRAGHYCLLDIPLKHRCVTGKLDSHNAHYVLAMLERAAQGCLDGEFAAMVTAPIHKGNINNAGIPFTGHTEFLAKLCNTKTPVMMLATEGLRVALATTHIPLHQVAENITTETLETVLTILDEDLKSKFAISSPRILVCGLNPHAGEDGHLGSEEIETIIPLLEKLRTQGMNLIGPLPADTAFTPNHLAEADAVLAMYHDQGLPVLKHMGFGNAVNITLGLPIIRTSVDHGTALELAGTGRADSGSLDISISTAIDMMH
ncbi:MAG: 4-hydroxythreonine-4-phosphate dehydrogenase PdxA [Sulfuriflexus sp.]|nr:4-hydroxythreonine-4-phosphate dehydrogenase PdxA [Sulfuriflexus sp.]